MEFFERDEAHKYVAPEETYVAPADDTSRFDAAPDVQSSPESAEQEQTPAEPEGSLEKTGEEQEEITVSDIKREMSSWYKAIDEETDPDSKDILFAGYARIIDKWLDELNQMDTPEAQDLARELNELVDKKMWKK